MTSIVPSRNLCALPIQTVVVSDVPDASSLHQLGISRWRMFLPVRLSIEAVARSVGESHDVIKFFAGSKSCVGWWYPPSPRLLGLPFLVVVSGSGSTAQGVARKTPRFGLNPRLATQYGCNIPVVCNGGFLPTPQPRDWMPDKHNFTLLLI